MKRIKLSENSIQVLEALRTLSKEEFDEVKAIVESEGFAQIFAAFAPLFQPNEDGTRQPAPKGDLLTWSDDVFNGIHSLDSKGSDYDASINKVDEDMGDLRKQDGSISDEFQRRFKNLPYQKKEFVQALGTALDLNKLYGGIMGRLAGLQDRIVDQYTKFYSAQSTLTKEESALSAMSNFIAKYEKLGELTGNDALDAYVAGKTDDSGVTMEEVKSNPVDAIATFNSTVGDRALGRAMDVLGDLAKGQEEK